MSQYDQDPFAKYDKIFDEQDKKNIVKPATQTKKEQQQKPSSGLTDSQKQKAVRVIITVAFVVLIFQFLPVILIRGGYTFAPIFSIIFTIIIINIIIKAFRR